MDVRIRPGRARGTVSAPPSKSCAHRLMICAALARGTSTVCGIQPSQDMLATLDCITALGARCALRGDTAVICGGLNELSEGAVLPCRESGSTLRFLLPAALLGGGTAVFTGSERLLRRGVGVYEALLPEKGICMERRADGIAVSGRLAPGQYALPGGVSSQFISGLLFALPLLAGDSVLTVLPPVESRPYIDLTVDALRRFGVEVSEPERNRFLIPGGQAYRPGEVTVEGDWSNAAALLAFNLTGGDVTVSGLDGNSLQGDRVCLDCLERLRRPGARIDLSDCPDLGPVLFAAAAAAGRGAQFTGTRRLRLKESDRVAAMAEELSRFGIAVEAGEDIFRVLPGTPRAPEGPLCAHNDHRIVMALGLLCAVTGGVIAGAQAVEKSFPGYFDSLRRLGLEVEHVT